MTANLQISKKLPDGTILVVGGETAADFAKNLLDIIGETGRDAIRSEFYSLIPDGGAEQRAVATVQAALAAFPGSQPAQAPAQQPPAAPQQPAAQPPGQAPTCNHGYAREFKSGISKNKKPYKLWACPADRSEQCEPVWA